ncbi:hypothetical protein [Candidatus Poriferisodalis sp.]|uniref:hypothetical protein n=1 Tax=Candidatus Poriferisodalis sp. TaxID=3101277 RepID=UPI003B02D41E
MNWYATSLDCEVVDLNEVVVFICPDGLTEIRVRDVPTCGRAAIFFRDRLVLTTDLQEAALDDVVFYLVADTDFAPRVDIRGPILNVNCTTHQANRRDYHTSIQLDSDAALCFGAGSWHLSGPTGPVLPAVRLRCEDSQAETTIRGDAVTVEALDTDGDHVYGLPFETGAEITLRSGRAAFEGDLRDVRISDEGSSSDSRPPERSDEAPKNSLHVTGNLTGCAIDIAGDVTVKGDVDTQSEQKVRCRDLNVEGAIESHAKVRCRSLDVHGELLGTAGLHAYGSARCRQRAEVSEIEVDDSARFDGALECSSATFVGHVVLRGSLKKTLAVKWRPTRPRAVFEVRPSSQVSDNGDLVLGQLLLPNEGRVIQEPRLRIPTGTRIGSLRMEIPHLDVAVVGTGGKPSSGADPGGFARVALVALSRFVSIELHEGDLSVTVDVEKRKSVSISAAVRHDATLSLEDISTAVSELQLSCDGTARLRDSNPDAQLNDVKLAGSGLLDTAVDISGLTSEVARSSETAGSDDPDSTCPRLMLAGGTVVRNAQGICSLRGLQGRIYGADDGELSIVDIEAAADADEAADGHLLNVNLNNLPARQVELLRPLRVLEISATSLQRFATERTWLLYQWSRIPWTGDRESPLTRDDVRERAEKLAAIFAAVGKRVNSGRSRSWLLWSVMRLQHRGLGKLAPERALRALYRMVGYGYRPLVAAASWFAVAGLLLLVRHYSWFDIRIGFLPRTSDVGAYIELLFAPVTYFRPGSRNSIIFDPAWLSHIARVMLGVPFLFTVLGLRQYLKSPVR